MLRVKPYEIYVSAARYITVDFTSSEKKLNTTVSSVSWDVTEGTTIELSDFSASSGIAKALATSKATAGCNMIRATATMANGEILPGYIELSVIKPTCQ